MQPQNVLLQTFIHDLVTNGVHACKHRHAACHQLHD